MLEKIKTLRERTGLGILECKEALLKTNGDIEKSITYLKEKGVIKSLEKAARKSGDGITHIVSNNDTVYLVDIACETDFVSRNATFIEKTKDLSTLICKNNIAVEDKENNLITSNIQELTHQFGENIYLRHIEVFKNTDSQYVAYYVHQGGKIGVVALFHTDSKETHQDTRFKELTKDVCMQICAMIPKFISLEDVDAQWTEEQKNILKAQIASVNKPEKVKENILSGKIKQLYKEIVLLEQVFVKDSSFTISQLVDQYNKEKSENIKIVKFVRHSLD